MGECNKIESLKFLSEMSLSNTKDIEIIKGCIKFNDKRITIQSITLVILVLTLLAYIILKG